MSDLSVDPPGDLGQIEDLVKLRERDVRRAETVLESILSMVQTASTDVQNARNALFDVLVQRDHQLALAGSASGSTAGSGTAGSTALADDREPDLGSWNMPWPSR